MTPVEINAGDGPIVLGLPHTGTFLPGEIFGRLTDLGKTLSDTDWHIHRLYDGLLPGVTTVRATFHRYLIDANRDPSGASLYPGQNTTDLVPLTDFDGRAIWLAPPTAAEIEHHCKSYHAIYHDALERELHRVRERHGVAVLYDCHSIRSKIPYLFEGTLPDFNIGTDEGRTCAREIEHAVESVCLGAADYTSTTNGRFKGGWTTRHYGQPEQNIHAIQMELAQSTHLISQSPPFDYDKDKAKRLRTFLKEILNKLAELAPQIARPS